MKKIKNFNFFKMQKKKKQTGIYFYLIRIKKT
jgi:hypothetical protein